MSRFGRSRFLLNSAVITHEGTYDYRLVEPGEARAWLKQPYVSRVRFMATADAIEMLLGTRPDVDRTPVEMRPGDEALVVRLTTEVTDGTFVTPEFVATHVELGILTRLTRDDIEERGLTWRKSPSNSKSKART